MDEDELIRIRKDKVVKFFRKNYNAISYVVLAIIVYIAVKIRVSNLPGLKDITTGTWTLGPDLDPFLFLRWAKYIIEHGKLMVLDTMRYSPLGLRTGTEYPLLPYSIAWFHKYLGWTFGTESVTHSAVIFPAAMFGLTVIAFFFMTRKMFIKSLGGANANIIGLVASFFFSVMPIFLPRTIAGIPEKESLAFLFMFLAFYFFLSAWESKKLIWSYGLALFAGLSTALMGLTWGGYSYIYLILTPTVLVAFLLGKIEKKEFFVYLIWILSSFVVMLSFFERNNLKDLLSSLNIAPSIAVLFMIAFHIFLFKKMKKYIPSKLKWVPPQVTSAIFVVILAIVISSLVFDLSYVPNQIQLIINNLVKPAKSRLIQTVAENRQPYFGEWEESFGPHIHEFAITFWLFFVGSIYLFYNMIRVVKKRERFVMTTAYVFFLVALVFSRYSSSSTFNGENFISLLFYALGFVVFLGTSGFYYYKYFKEGKEESLKEISVGYLLIFTFFFLSILSARGAVRLIMMLAPPASIIVAYLAVASVNSVKKIKKGSDKIFWEIIVSLILIATVFSGYKFHQEINGQAQAYVPSIYTQQWQKAMAWVRENTPQDAVFGHWWDYGYWLQSIGERATVLDGGNTISYWNHLMGRYVLTAPDEMDALEFLYAHNTTHFLIDSTDIGKYSAFSTIGSDVNYDRASYIPTFIKNQNQAQEKKNSTVFIYSGGVGLDEDIIYEQNGTKIFLPAGSAGLGAILTERDKDNKLISAPIGIFVYQGRQYNLPLRYAFDKELIDFGEGLDAGIFFYPGAVQSGQSLQIDPYGALLYLSKRTVHSQLARIYLHGDRNSRFKLVHSEDDFVVAQIKSQNQEFTSDFIYYGGFRGPIRIWEIDYPEDMLLKEEFISTDYPEDIAIAR